MTRIGLIADIHANEEALLAAAAALRDVDYLACLGDTAGYGPAPEECLDWVRRRARVAIRGNHEDGLLGERELDWFTEPAQAALEWQRDHVSRESIDWMVTLPMTQTEAEVLFVHGRPPRSNTSYTTSRLETDQAMRTIRQEICVVGHSRLPALHLGRRRSRLDPRFEWNDVSIRSRMPVRFERGMHILLNPGSVGQPRDRNPLASAAVLDSGRREVEFRRVAYPVDKTRARILDARLPVYLADRLVAGT